MNHRAIQVVVAGAMLACGVLTAADETAKNLFQDMGQAVEALSYRGTFVHVHDNRPETLEVLHKLKDGKVFERMTSLTGSGVEIIRRGDEVRCIFQKRKEVLVDWRADQSPLRILLPTYDKTLERYYDFQLHEQGGRIANRATHYIAIKPKDEFRYGYRLWLDAENSMPLACELVGEQGKVIEAIQFTEITFSDAIADEEFQPRLSSTNYAELPSPPRNDRDNSSNTPHWIVDDLPVGFTLTVVNQHQGSDDHRVEHLVFTDGLASISVFAEPARDSYEVIDGVSNVGTASAYGRRVADFQITVVGEVPPATVVRIGKSIRQER